MFLPFANFTTLALRAAPCHNTTLVTRQAPTNLTISTNGQCSGGQTCLGSQFGESCSRWGYCGPSDDTNYSGLGCMSEFGVCASNSTTRTNSSVSAVPTTMSTMTLTSSTSESATVPSSETAYSSSSSSNASPTTETALSTSSSAASSSTSGAAGAPTSTTSAAALSSPSTSANSFEPSNQYTQFTGTGSQSDGWPVQSSWKPFDTLFEMNHQIMLDSCAQWNVPNDTLPEIDFIKSALVLVSESSGIDPRFILAIMLQESNGCVRAPVTSLSVKNPGLLQSYMGSAKCNSGSATTPADVQTPCPSQTVHDMIEQGTVGTVPGGMSLTYALQKSGASDDSKYYKAARIYNSGSIAASGLLEDGVATHCYASDIANRLMGWSLGPSGCTLNSS